MALGTPAPYAPSWVNHHSPPCLMITTHLSFPTLSSEPSSMRKKVSSRPTPACPTHQLASPDRQNITRPRRSLSLDTCLNLWRPLTSTTPPPGWSHSCRPPSFCSNTTTL